MKMSAVDIYNEVKMTWTGKRLASVLVEGLTDKRFVGSRVQASSVSLIVCDGKETAVSVARLCMGDNDLANAYVAIVDKDFDGMKGVDLERDCIGVVYYASRDLETMLIRNLEAFSKTMSVHGVSCSTDHEHGILIGRCFHVISLISALRYNSKEKNLNFTFDGINYRKALDVNKGEIAPTFSAHFRGLRSKCGKFINNTFDEKHGRLDYPIESEDIHNGKDLIGYFVEYIKVYGGGQRKQSVNDEDFVLFLDLSFPNSAFSSLSIYRELQKRGTHFV